MRIVISVPNDLFQKGECLSRRLGLSRSALYCRALEELIERSRNAEMVATINRVLEQTNEGPDPFLRRAAEQLISKQDE